jgi:HprK-related kinase A
MTSANTVSDLSSPQLRERLARGSFLMRTGGFNVRVAARLDSVARAIAVVYADYPLLPEDGFSDFQVSLEGGAGLRRFFRRQVRATADGTMPFFPMPVAHAFPLFEWTLNLFVCVGVNSMLIIHAAVVEKNGLAAILPGTPGSGKSTLCAALVNRGWRLLSDELTLVRVADGLIEPLPRPVSLKNASIDIVAAYAPQAVFSDSVSDTSKGTIAHMKPPADSVRRAGEAAQPAWLIFPKFAAGAATQLTPMSRASGFMKLADNAFNYSNLGLQGFETAADLIEAVDCYDFRYSVLDEAIATFDALAAAGRPAGAPCMYRAP